MLLHALRLRYTVSPVEKKPALSQDPYKRTNLIHSHNPPTLSSDSFQILLNQTLTQTP